MSRLTHLAIALPFFIIGCSSSSESDSSADRVTSIAALDADVTAGATVYAANCTSCHGEDGKSGSVAKNAAADASNESEAIEQVLGGGDGMPAFPELSDQDIADVVAYLASLN